MWYERKEIRVRWHFQKKNEKKDRKIRKRIKNKQQRATDVTKKLINKGIKHIQY